MKRRNFIRGFLGVAALAPIAGKAGGLEPQHNEKRCTAATEILANYEPTVRDTKTRELDRLVEHRAKLIDYMKRSLAKNRAKALGLEPIE